MGDLVCINKPDDSDRVIETETSDVSRGNAIVPTIDIYSARVLLTITQKMVEDTVDRRISKLENSIRERDQEIMRAIRKMQARMVMRRENVQLPWWRKLFGSKSKV